MSGSRDLAALERAVARDPEDAGALLALVRGLHRAGRRSPTLEQEELAEPLAELFLDVPRERALWPLVLAPLGLEVVPGTAGVGDWWARHDRLGRDGDVLFDVLSGLPLVLGRRDGGLMNLAPRGREAAASVAWLDRYPVTRRSWRAVVGRPFEDGPPPGPLEGLVARMRGEDPEELPVAWTRRGRIRDYLHALGLELPSPGLWSMAATGGDGRTYPWGDAAPRAVHASLRTTTGRLVPVTTTRAGAGPFGHRDLLGNTREVTSETRDSDSYMSNKSWRTVAGRAFDEDPAPAPGLYSWRYTKDPPPGVLGFRTALDPTRLPGRLRALRRQG